MTKMPNEQKQPKPVKPRKAWAIANPNGVIDETSVESTKKKCIYWKAGYQISTRYASKRTLEAWEKMESDGYRCVRVVIQDGDDSIGDYCPKCGECQVVCYCSECEKDLNPTGFWEDTK